MSRGWMEVRYCCTPRAEMRSRQVRGLRRMSHRPRGSFICWGHGVRMEEGRKGGGGERREGDERSWRSRKQVGDYF